MCKAYRGAPTVDLLRSFLNLGPAGDWLTLSNSRSVVVPTALHNSITYLGGNSPSAKYANNDALMIDATPISSVYPSNIVENVADFDDPSYGNDEQTLVGPSLPPYLEASKKLKIPGKRKVVGEASSPLDVDSDFDIHEFTSAKELKNATDCHWVVAHVTPPSWKQHLRGEKWVDYEQTLSSLWAKIKGIESERERLKSSEIQLLQEIDNLKQDRSVVVSRVILDAAMKLICSDGLGVLIAKLVRSFIIYGRCQDFKEVVAMEEPFVLEKMSGFRPSSKEEYDQASDALANASYPFLAEYVINPHAFLE
nr:hypothetical protein [Tanacetum cinerariifolium]